MGLHADHEQSRHLSLTVQIFDCPIPTFQLFGYTGFLLSFVQSLFLTIHLGLSLFTLLGVTGTVILTFYVLMVVTKILAGGEVIIYYHHEIAVITAAALFLRLTRQPVLPYLDVLVLGLGLFLAFGRLGCLMVGCCYGRPCRWGVSYGQHHVHAGFPSCLAGVKLFPIQAVESAFAACIVSIGLFFLLQPHKNGSVLLIYVLAYGCGRFCLEFFRGDADRRYLLGFSEAQWTSLVLALAIVLGERLQLLPAARWHLAAAATMVGAMVLVQVRRRFDTSRSFFLLHPVHLKEISVALRHLKSLQQQGPAPGWDQGAGVIYLVRTSFGYRISAGRSSTSLARVEHFSVSRESGDLSVQGATTLGRLLLRLSECSESFDLIQRSNGVFHIILHPQEVPGLQHSPEASRYHEPTLHSYIS